MNVSVIILAKNAEKLLKDCIESVNFADEIIVIDNNSTDDTKKVAKKLGARVLESSEQSFAKRRDIGKEYAKGDWIFYIDTDERVSKELHKNMLSVIAGDAATIAAYKIHRQNFYLGNHPWPKIELLERLFKKEKLKGWYGDLHESPEIAGAVGVLDGYLLHYTHQDLTSMLKKTIVWSDKEAKLRYDAHHPKMTTWRFLRVMLTAFWDSYITQGGYQAGTVGFIESTYQAFSMFITYAKLWELQQK